MTQPPLDLRRLRYFLAVAEASSFRRAAEKLGMAQPPLSQQIMALEAQLGQRLFVRQARTVELTDAGLTLRELAEPLLAAVAAIPARVERAARGQDGTLSIGFTPGATLHPLPPRALRAFRKAAPGIDLVFEETNTVPLCDRVADGKVHIAFIRPPAPARDRLKVEHITDEPILVGLPRTHPLAAAPTVALADVADDDIVLFDRTLAPAMYDAILAAFSEAGVEPRIVHHAPQKASAMMLAAGGGGITFVPASMRGVQADALVLRHLDGPRPAASLAMAMREGAQCALAQRFRQTVLAEAALLEAESVDVGRPDR